MVLAVAADKTAYGYLDTMTLTLTGGAASTAYIVSIGVSGTTAVARVAITTDGSGNGTGQYVHQTAKVVQLTISARPAAEHNGTTTAAAAITTTGKS